ncbi:hypothetical protein V1523DRAFT_399742 [Lipomyces doorenjongii]
MTVSSATKRSRAYLLHSKMKSVHPPKLQPGPTQIYPQKCQQVGNKSGLSYLYDIWMPFMFNFPVRPQPSASEFMDKTADKSSIQKDFVHVKNGITNARDGKDPAAVAWSPFDETDIEIVPFPQRRQRMRVRYPNAKVDSGSLRVKLLKHKYIKRKQLALKSHKIRLIRDRLAAQMRALGDAVGRNHTGSMGSTEEDNNEGENVINLVY